MGFTLWLEGVNAASTVEDVEHWRGFENSMIEMSNVIPGCESHDFGNSDLTYSEVFGYGPC